VFEDWMDDLRCVLAAVGSERAVLFGYDFGDRLALLLAATHPDQVSAVVTFGSQPTPLRDQDYPWGATPQERQALLPPIQAGTLDPAGILTTMAPQEATDASVLRWVAGVPPVGHQPGGGRRGAQVAGPRRHPRAAGVGAGAGAGPAVVALVQEFLTGATPVADPDRVLATVLFTDLVDSTSRVAELGDQRWHRLLEQHQVVRRQLARYRGREVKTTGDGFLATFDGPARAIRAADAVRAELKDLGLQVRVGLHTGECELLGDDIGGIAVHIAARVLAQASAGEIWCSRTVKDLVAGAGFAFIDRGSYRLKGVPDRWQLFAAELAARSPVVRVPVMAVRCVGGRPRRMGQQWEAWSRWWSWTSATCACAP
jgi:class 3 adenylate cyclase